ncbi:MAG: LysR family transcriptional regulator [Treponema sp.]|jgi:lysyl-tRNA synthetase class 2|nr:LysR family transcriptional regulator [Treponema sp.]
MDIERLVQRAEIVRKIRAFFTGRGYLELDTPALSPDLIPETCLEVFETVWYDPHGNTQPLYLAPSPEIYLKPIIAKYKIPVFQVSKCYRNYESSGHIHSPEFTMLEYYTMNADYRDSIAVTEDLFRALDVPSGMQPPFIRLTLDDAFAEYAGFRLSEAQTPAALAEQARNLGIAESAASPFDRWPWDDLYELILVHAVEPSLPRDTPTLLMDYPAQVPCLAKDAPAPGRGRPVCWKERWELYCDGMELANCYTEETDPWKVKAYFEREGELKAQTARIPHGVTEDYWKLFRGFPDCSGVALGVDRLAALMCGAASIEGVLPFPLSAPSLPSRAPA